MQKKLLKNIIETLLFVNSEPINYKDIHKCIEKTILFNNKEEKNESRENLTNDDLIFLEKEINNHFKDKFLQYVKEINLEYKINGRPFEIIQIAKGWKIYTNNNYSLFIKNFLDEKDTRSLSQAVLETLTIIAYKQPIISAEIERIRGVNCNNSINILLEKNLIKYKKSEKLPGKPRLFSTTDSFLQYLAINTIKDLPNYQKNIQSFNL